MISLKGKFILITGASSGIGKASAELLASHKANLILIARRISRLQKLAQYLISKYEIKVLTIELDVRNYNKIRKVMKSLPDGWKKIDILINNAGLSRGLNKIQDGELNDWEEMIDTNIKGLLYITKEVIPMMLKRNSGHILNIGSIAGHEVYPGGNVYCASKHAVDAITKGCRIDLLGTPIKVSTIDPGMVETEFSLVRYHGDKKKAKITYKGLKPLRAEDIAEAIEFVLTRDYNVNIAEMIIFPKYQAGSNFVHRDKL